MPLNLPGLGRKAPSPEDMNFNCLDDSSVMSEDPHGLEGLLEQNHVPEKKTSNSSSVSVFARLKSLGRGKKKSDDTVMTSFGNKDVLEEGEEDSSSSSEESEDIHMYGKTKLPDKLLDLGNESSSDEDDEDDNFQYMPKSKRVEGISDTGLRRPSLLTAPSGMNLTRGSTNEPSSSSRENKANDGNNNNRTSLLAAPSGMNLTQGLNDPFRFMDSKPTKKNSGAASVMPSSEGYKRSRPSMLSAPSGRNMMADLSPRKESHKIMSTLPSTAEDSEEEDCNDQQPVLLPRPKMLPAPDGGDMLDLVSPSRGPRPKGLVVPPQLPPPLEKEEEDLEETPAPQPEPPKTPVRPRARRRGDGTMRNSGSGSALSVQPTTTERQPRRRNHHSSRSNHTAADLNASGELDNSSDDLTAARDGGGSKRAPRRRRHSGSNVPLSQIPNSGKEEGDSKEQSADVTATKSDGDDKNANGLHTSCSQMEGIAEEMESEDAQKSNQLPVQLPNPPKQEFSLNFQEEAPVTQNDEKASSSTPPQSPRRIKSTRNEGKPPSSPTQKTRKKFVHPSPITPSKPKNDDTPKAKPHSPRKNKVAPSPRPTSPKKVPSSPRKDGAKSKMAGNAALMNKLTAPLPLEKEKKPKESESVMSGGGFMIAPPSRNTKANMIRAPSCSNFQMDAPAKASSRPKKNGLGNHFGGDVHKSQRSSATVTGHGVHDTSRKMERRPKPRKRNGASSVVPMPASARLRQKEAEQEADDNVVHKKPGFSNNIEDLVAEEDEDTKELAEELQNFLTASQHARRASMSDIPSTHGPSPGGNHGKSTKGPRRHSLSSVSAEETGGEAEKKRSDMERLLDQKPVGKPGPKKRDSQSVVVGRTPDPHTRVLRPKSKTSDDIDTRGHKGNTPSRPHSGKSPHDSFTKDSANGPKHGANPYGKNSVFAAGEGAKAQDGEETRNVPAKRSPNDMARKKAGEEEGRRREAPRSGNRPRPPHASNQRRTHPPGKLPRTRAGTARRPGDRKPPHRASPTSVINGAVPAKNGERHNLDAKLVKEKQHPTPHYHADEVSLSSHADETGDGVAAQLSFLPGGGMDGNVGVKYNNVDSILGESFRLAST